MFEILLREASLLIVGASPVEDAFNNAHQSLLYTRLGDNVKAEAQWQEAIKIAPREPALWLGRGRAFAELGRYAEADAAFAQAATLTPDELDRFIQAGWWVVGPYPQNLQFFCPPEKDPDPSRPVAAVENRGGGGATRAPERKAGTESVPEDAGGRDTGETRLKEEPKAESA
jgi:tetratricopeptide (TPR) repeat protein